LKRARSADLIEAFKLAIVFGLVAVGGFLGEQMGGTLEMVAGIILFSLIGLVTCCR
jgi:hypothetical protein